MDALTATRRRPRSLKPPRRQLTTALVAAELGVTPARVRQLAQAHQIGEAIDGRTKLYDRADLAKFRKARGKRGRPRKVAP